MISKQSRYLDGVLRVIDTKPETVTVQRRFPNISNARYSYVTWEDSMRLDLLAARVFGNPLEWWRILDMNPLIQSPQDLRPGMRVKIPNA
jgi:hypothetical protein